MHPGPPPLTSSLLGSFPRTHACTGPLPSISRVLDPSCRRPTHDQGPPRAPRRPCPPLRRRSDHALPTDAPIAPLQTSWKPMGTGLNSLVVKDMNDDQGFHGMRRLGDARPCRQSTSGRATGCPPKDARARKSWPENQWVLWTHNVCQDSIHTRAVFRAQHTRPMAPFERSWSKRHFSWRRPESKGCIILFRSCRPHWQAWRTTAPLPRRWSASPCLGSADAKFVNSKMTCTTKSPPRTEEVAATTPRVGVGAGVYGPVAIGRHAVQSTPGKNRSSTRASCAVGSLHVARSVAHPVSSKNISFNTEAKTCGQFGEQVESLPLPKDALRCKQSELSECVKARPAHVAQRGRLECICFQFTCLRVSEGEAGMRLY